MKQSVSPKKKSTERYFKEKQSGGAKGGIDGI